MARLVAVLLAAVTLTVAAAAPSAGAATARTFATFRQTGGIAGVDVHLVVRKDRTLVVTRRGERTVRGRLRAATFRRLRAALDAAHLERRLSPTQTGCADCFVYAIGYGGHRAQFDDVSFPPRMRGAVARLRAIAEGAR